MEASRWLLPFTYGVDMRAVDLAVSLAARAGATLIPVSLISVPPERRSRGARLEHIQQSKDFLEAAMWKADRYSVKVERYEIFTADVMQSISLLVHDLNADAVVLVTTGDRDVLVQAHELKRLMESPPTSLLIIRMSVPSENVQPPSVAGRFLFWLQQLWQSRNMDAETERNELFLQREEPLWIRQEGYFSR